MFYHVDPNLIRAVSLSISQFFFYYYIYIPWKKKAMLFGAYRYDF